jgi:hypothetical protein
MEIRLLFYANETFFHGMCSIVLDDRLKQTSTECVTDLDKKM